MCIVGVIFEFLCITNRHKCYANYVIRFQRTSFIILPADFHYY